MFINWYGIHPAWLESSTSLSHSFDGDPKLTVFTVHLIACWDWTDCWLTVKWNTKRQRSSGRKEREFFRMKFLYFCFRKRFSCGQSEFQSQRSSSWNTSLAWSVVYRVLRNVGWSCNLLTGFVIVPTEKWWRQRWGMRRLKQ